MTLQLHLYILSAGGKLSKIDFRNEHYKACQNGKAFFSSLLQLEHCWLGGVYLEQLGCLLLKCHYFHVQNGDFWVKSYFTVFDRMGRLSASARSFVFIATLCKYSAGSEYD